MINIKQIFSGMSCFFAISENKAFYGWGENDFNQITGINGENFIPQPKSLNIPIYLIDNVSLISGNGTTFLLSSKPL